MVTGEMKSYLTLWLVCLLSCLEARTVKIVRSEAELRLALRSVTTDMTIRIEAGSYGSGYAVQDIDGLIIEGVDPKNPPHFEGGKEAWHFSCCDRLQLRHLFVRGQQANGINIDDGGDRAHPTTKVLLSHIVVQDIGPKGNFDAIKCSGIDELVIENCQIKGWGGQAIDFVGCHRSIIRSCKIEGKEGYSCTSGIQLKGGCSEILVEECTLIDAGPRPLNLGGSTGLDYFRPAGALYEAKQLTVRKNRISGGECAAAFVGVDGCVFSENTIQQPSKWIFRVLQETVEPGFAPCRQVVIEKNEIIFSRSKVQTEINIGPNTAVETFRFLGNVWIAEDKPSASEPRLPVPEKQGVYGRRLERKK